MDHVNSAEMSAKLAKLGLAAVLAYGLFDGVTYTSFFVLAFLGYEKSTGKNPAANIQALIGIVIMMWTGNNVTRPFRVAGAAALAPTIDNGLRRIQKALNFPTLFYAFALVVQRTGSPAMMPGIQNPATQFTRMAGSVNVYTHLVTLLRWCSFTDVLGQTAWRTFWPQTKPLEPATSRTIPGQIQPCPLLLPHSSPQSSHPHSHHVLRYLHRFGTNHL